jgi:hypothetical protein
MDGLLQWAVVRLGIEVAEPLIKTLGDDYFWIREYGALCFVFGTF